MRAPLFAISLGLFLLGVAPAADSLNVRLVGSCPTPTQALCLALKGDYAFVVDAESGLRVISVADPTHPVEVGHFDTLDVVGASVCGDYAYVAESPSGLRIASVADPAHPTEVGYCDTPDWSASLSVNGSYAYLAQHDSGLRVISVADPAHPVEVGHCDLPSMAIWVDIVGDYAYVANYDSGLMVVSIADPAHPAVVGHVDTPGMAAGVTVVGGYAYVADLPDLRVISVADPAHPTEVGHYSSPYALGVAVSGSLAYVADISDGVRVASVADPANPTEVGYYRGDYMISGVAVDDDYIYAAGVPGLQIHQFYGGGVEESPKPQAPSRKLAATVVRGVLHLEVGSRQQTVDRAAPSDGGRCGQLLDAVGRKVLDLKPGANDVSMLAPGVYFVREGPSAVGGQPSAVHKVVVTR
jgi:hypothetical protein